MNLATAIAMLRDAYPRQDFPDRSVAMYAQLLADLGEGDVLAAVTRLCKSRTWLPTVGEIRTEVAEGRLRLPSVEEAWDIAMRGSLRGAPPEVRAAVDAVGGRWAILHGDNPSVVYSQFRKDYSGRRDNAIREFMGARVVPELPPAEMVALGPTMASLPETERIRPRPVQHRWLRRVVMQEEVGPPTEEEKRDAIAVIGAGTWAANPADDPLYSEAERIFAEGGADRDSR